MPDEPKSTLGHCLCGDIQYEYRGAPSWILHCHCESCRRHSSAAVATFICVNRDAFRFTKGQPKAYASSPGVRRSFCGRCGSPIAYENDRMPNEVHLYLGTLAHPSSVSPEAHVSVAEQLSWFEILDDLPRYEGWRRGASPVRRGPRPVEER